MSKVDTINYQGKDYATVPARLKEFRSTFPRASITTEPTFLEDGSLMFRATIISDLSDEHSARASGTAMYRPNELSKAKAFEKLETISIGRALAILGFLNDGQIASTEELQEFEQYKSDRIKEQENEAISSLESAKSIDELKSVFTNLGELMALKTVIAAKDKRKAELNEDNKS